jgi:predicted nucleotidyltransferase component of viral defense system
MITKAQIIRLASREGVPAKTVERDYVLAHIVAAIAELGQDAGSMLVFKGGSALRLCHVEGYRYSADLDFSVVGGSLEDALEVIARALGAAGGSAEGLRLTDDVPPRIAYLGPLGRERTLKLDLADDEIVVHTERRVLLPRWPDLPADASVHVYTLLEIAAEKLRCVLQRLQCRDLLDLHLLFGMAIDPAEAAELFRSKARQRRLDPAAFPSRYRERLRQYQGRWEAELSEHVPGSLPHFGEIERQVSRHLRRGGLL